MAQNKKTKYTKPDAVPASTAFGSDSLSDWIGTEEAARLLGMRATSVAHILGQSANESAGTARAARFLIGHKIGRSWIVLRPSIDIYLQARKNKGRGAKATGKQSRRTRGA